MACPHPVFTRFAPRLSAKNLRSKLIGRHFLHFAMDNSYTSGPFLAPSYATTPLFDPGEQLDQWTMDPMLSWQPYAYPMQGSNAEVGWDFF